MMLASGSAAEKRNSHRGRIKSMNGYLKPNEIYRGNAKDLGMFQKTAYALWDWKIGRMEGEEVVGWLGRWVVGKKN